jgi:hypothetical protein
MKSSEWELWVYSEVQVEQAQRLYLCKSIQDCLGKSKLREAELISLTGAIADRVSVVNGLEWYVGEELICIGFG